MAQTYSTLRRDAADGRIYSSQYSSVTVLPPTGKARGLRPQPLMTNPNPAATEALLAPQQAPPQVAPAAAPDLPATPTAPAAAEPAGSPARRLTFTLGSQGLPPVARIAPGGATGSITISGSPGEPYRVTGSIQGIRPLTDPAMRPVLWLIHDLTVPYDLSPADRAALPRGTSGIGNQAGAQFTIDGSPPTYTPNCNTVSICISPGSFALEPDGTWKLEGSIDAGTNQAFHPLVFLGPGALADMNTPLPSGTVARILTHLFLRSATVHPELNIRTHFPQRLMVIVRDVLGAASEPSFLEPELFTRAAVTVEGLVRTTPSLMPSRETTFLLANHPVAG